MDSQCRSDAECRERCVADEYATASVPFGKLHKSGARHVEVVCSIHSVEYSLCLPGLRLGILRAARASVRQLLAPTPRQWLVLGLHVQRFVLTRYATHGSIIAVWSCHHRETFWRAIPIPKFCVCCSHEEY